MTLKATDSVLTSDACPNCPDLNDTFSFHQRHDKTSLPSNTFLYPPEILRWRAFRWLGKSHLGM